MIYQIEIENFLSIKDRQVIDLRVSGKVPDDFAHFAPIFPGATTRAPKIVALYGANASGKTNVLMALAFVIHFISNHGFPDATSKQKDIYLAPFNDEESQTRPVKFALEFAGIMGATAELGEQARRGEPVAYGTCRYELELAMSNGVIEAVSRESLRQRANDQGKWQRIFERDGAKTGKGSPSFPIKGFPHLLKTLDPCGSVIAGFAQFDHSGARYWRDIAKSMNFMIELIVPFPDDALINFLYQNPVILKQLNDDLQKIDVAIEYMRVELSGIGVLVKFKHNSMERELPWHRQSHGTRAFIRHYPLIEKTLESGGVAVIDELDAALHPFMVAEILGRFHNPKRNPCNAQLWFSGHTATLMDDLSMEEIIFCEKDRQGRTNLFRARDIARRSDNLRRKYLSGVYGAVPQIG